MKSLLNRLQVWLRRLSDETKAHYVQAFVNALRLAWEIFRFVHFSGNIQAVTK